MRVRTWLILLALACGLVAAAPRPPALDPEGAVATLAETWRSGPPASVLALRAQNPEWDLMSRTFLTLTLADRALAEPARLDAALASIDAVLSDTLAQDSSAGQQAFLLPYAAARPWIGDGRSLFVDGEILVMLGARRILRDDRWGEEFRARAAVVEAELLAGGGGPGRAESYPDEGWTFCHVMALVGLRMAEVLDGRDERAPRTAFLGWIEQIREPSTGLLAAEFDMRGRMKDGPEGSSAWWTATGLLLVDPTLARDQYTRARSALGATLGGWAYAREWPRGQEGRVDIDSGPLVPVLGASPSSSGFALVASNAFGDTTWHAQLVSALSAANAVMSVDPRLASAADNPMGQAVLAWGLHFGPLWRRLGAPDGAR